MAKLRHPRLQEFDIGAFISFFHPNNHVLKMIIDVVLVNQEFNLTLSMLIKLRSHANF